jgi:hypothetical protein
VSKNITENFDKFPNGIKGLSGSLRNKGLKLGLGSDIGVSTCANQPGSYGFEQQDTLTYANWQYFIPITLEQTMSNIPIATI